MDDTKEGLLLIGSSMIVLTVFLLAVVAVMIIYRRRRLEHIREIDGIQEKFSRELLQTQVEVQQQTMQTIGREIHDNVGQKLTLAVLYVQQLQATGEEEQRKINAIAGIINESLSDLRGLSKNLTHAHTQDLVQLIRRECSKVQATGFCEASFQSNVPKIQASAAVKSFVLRILQEFIQNSLKHAGCSLIQVDVQLGDQTLTVEARDNGKGFDQERLHTEGIGLTNMRRRAQIIQAQFELTSTPGTGTQMTLTLPITGLNV